jgi:hypothetical protein
LGGGDEQYVSLSFRREVPDGAEGNRMIEIAAINVANGEPYALALPEGSYQLVASSYGYETGSYEIDIPQETTLTQDISLSVH